VISKGVPDRRAETATIVDDIRARLKHLDVAVTNDRQTANFIVTLVADRNLARTIRSLYGSDRATNTQVRREHDVTVLAALALLYADDHPRAVNVVDLERDHLGGAQAGAIGHAQRRLVLEPGCGFEQARHLLGAENHRQLARLANEMGVSCLCELRSLPSPGRYPASAVIRTSPPPHDARPVPRGRSVGHR
jgi:hypothetical protein